MNERAKITASRLSRHAIVYLRQSSAAQVEHNRESTNRQYALAAKARELGWPNDRIIVIGCCLRTPSNKTGRAAPHLRTLSARPKIVGQVMPLHTSVVVRPPCAQQS
jgi:hypothetical protein